MTYFKYKKLVQYITIIGDPNDKNKSFKYFYKNLDFLLQQHKFCRQTTSTHISYLFLKAQSFNKLLHNNKFKQKRKINQINLLFRTNHLKVLSAINSKPKIRITMKFLNKLISKIYQALTFKKTLLKLTKMIFLLFNK